MTWLTFLVTGPEPNLMAWQRAAMFSVELFDRRDQTVRCRVHGIDFMDLDNPAWADGDDKQKLRAAMNAQLVATVELAKRHDVTVQMLEDDGPSEAYPVEHLGTHGMKWPDCLPKKPPARKPKG